MSKALESLQKFSDALGGIKIVIEIASKILELNNIERENIIKLYKSLKIAVTRTKKFIESNNGEHLSNAELQELWLDAFENAQKTYLTRNTQFPSWLDRKADFWSNPKLWLQEPSSMEMVPTLNEIEKEIELLKGKLGL